MKHCHTLSVLIFIQLYLVSLAATAPANTNLTLTSTSLLSLQPPLKEVHHPIPDTNVLEPDPKTHHQHPTLRTLL